MSFLARTFAPMRATRAFTPSRIAAFHTSSIRCALSEADGGMFFHLPFIALSAPASTRQKSNTTTCLPRNFFHLWCYVSWRPITNTLLTHRRSYRQPKSRLKNRRAQTRERQQGQGRSGRMEARARIRVRTGRQG